MDAFLSRFIPTDTPNESIPLNTV